MIHNSTALKPKSTLACITPSSADDKEACDGLYRARHVLHLPGSSGNGSCADTGLLAHAVIHGMDHDLLNGGVLTDPQVAIERTVRGFSFNSEEGRALREIGPLVDQFTAFRRNHPDRLLAAELSVTTTAEPVPGRPNLLVYLSGRLDRLSLTDLDMPVIVDWKTTTSLCTSDELGGKLSTLVYAILGLFHLRRAGFQRFQAVEFGIFYLRPGIYVSTIVTMDQIDAGKERLAEFALSVTRGDPDLRPGPHCRRCPQVHSCPAFQGGEWL